MFLAKFKWKRTGSEKRVEKMKAQGAVLLIIRKQRWFERSEL